MSIIIIGVVIFLVIWTVIIKSIYMMADIICGAVGLLGIVLVVVCGANFDFATTIGISIVLGLILPVIIVPLLPYTKHFLKNGGDSEEIKSRLAKLEEQLSQNYNSEQNNIFKNLHEIPTLEKKNEN